MEEQATFNWWENNIDKIGIGKPTFALLLFLQSAEMCIERNGGNTTLILVGWKGGHSKGVMGQLAESLSS